MAEHSAIEWTHHTFNPWWGCTKVSEACRHCYAEATAKRFAPGNWGPTGRRRFFGDKHWAEPPKWNRKAAKLGERHRVFCASMADVFEELPDDHPDREAMHKARLRLWDMIGETPHLDWLLLTKRPENILQHAPWFASKHYGLDNVWLGTTVEDQSSYERVNHLLRAPARVRFLSCEPLLGPLELGLRGTIAKDIRPSYMAAAMYDNIHWVIAGGESGSRARSMHADWVRSLRDQCVEMGVPFFFKQWGEWLPDAGSNAGIRVGKKAAGRLLDGLEWSELPS